MKVPATLRRLIGRIAKAYETVDPNRGWFRVLEPFTGAYQRNIEIDRDSVLAYHAVYACITLIAQDIGKLRIKLVQKQSSGIWREVENPAFSPVLRKPNRFQTRIKFVENWITSKLIAGNAYALKGRDSRGVVNNLYLLDPTKVTPLVADNGEVFYRLKTDRLRELGEEIIVPADEIIHDTMVCLFHPLVGVSPIFACGLGAQQGVNIQNNSSIFFGNMSRPGGILTAPGHIEDDTAARVKAEWEERFGGDNVGRTAVLGDGLEWKPIAITAEDSQLIEQLKWTAEMCCSVFHVPAFMVGVGPMPAFNNIQALWQAYYSQCLQSLIESFELCMDEGLGLTAANQSLGVELDLRGLMRMDTASRYDAHTKGVAAGWLKPNEARFEEDLEPVVGGDTPYLQQQNYALAALARRDEEPKDDTDGAETNVQGTAMNGAQVTALQGIIAAVAEGKIPLDSARGAINAAFPLLSDAEVEAIIAPLASFKPSVQPTETPPAETPVDDTEQDDDDDEEELGSEEIEQMLRDVWSKEMTQ